MLTSSITWGENFSRDDALDLYLPNTYLQRIDGTLTPWIASLTAALDVLHPLPAGLLVIPMTSLLPPKAVVERVEDIHPPPASSPSQTARLKSINRITRSDWFQDVRHIELEIDGNSIA